MQNTTTTSDVPLTRPNIQSTHRHYFATFEWSPLPLDDQTSGRSKDQGPFVTSVLIREEEKGSHADHADHADHPGLGT